MAAGAEARSASLLESVWAWATDRVEMVQLREKTLDGSELLRLARTAVETVRQVETARRSAASEGRPTTIVVNGRPDVALAAGADGVHLTGKPGELRPGQVRHLFARAGRRECLVSVSCHSLREVRSACQAGADLLLFGPVFEKRTGGPLVRAGVGLGLLAEAVKLAGSVPVVALGGVTAENTPSCLAAGAGGIAGIRLFESIGFAPPESL